MKTYFGIAILVIGTSLIVFGTLFAGKSDNRNYITSRYDCNRLTLDSRETDVYCDNPQNASEYKATYSIANKFVYVGGVVTVLSIIYLILIKREPKRSVL